MGRSGSSAALVLEVNFAAPARGNEKGGVEGIIGYLQDNFFRPIPSFETLEQLNAALAVFCERDAEREHTSHHETIAARFTREQTALRPLPRVLPRACVTRYARVNKFAEVAFERDAYSVPSRYAYRDVAVEVYEDQLRFVLENAAIAQYPRGFGRGERFLDVAPRAVFNVCPAVRHSGRNRFVGPLPSNHRVTIVQKPSRNPLKPPEPVEARGARFSGRGQEFSRV
jgi:hypothetical protein